MEFQRDSCESVQEVHIPAVCHYSGICDRQHCVLMTQVQASKLNSVVSSCVEVSFAQLMLVLQFPLQSHSVRYSKINSCDGENTLVKVLKYFTVFKLVFENIY